MEDLRKRRSSTGRSPNQKYSDYGIARKEKQESAQERGDDSRRAEDEKWVWRVCLTFRLLNALLVRTYFNPDEHWQALEVAHRMVFGYGHLTWEWEWGIRSYVDPLIFAALYKLLALMGLDTPWFMARAPRLFQALFAAVGDLYLFKLSFQVFGRRTAYWTVSYSFDFFGSVPSSVTVIKLFLPTEKLFK